MIKSEIDQLRERNPLTAKQVAENQGILKKENNHTWKVFFRSYEFGVEPVVHEWCMYSLML